MRLGVLTTSYPRRPDDLAGTFVAGLAGWLAAQGDELEVLAPAPPAPALPPAEAEPRPGIRLEQLRYARRPRLFYGAGAPDNLQHPATWLQVPGFVLRLARACHARAAGWDAVISHWLLPCGVIAARAGRGLPHLAIAHSSDVHLLGRMGPLAAAALAALARPRTALLLSSEALRPLLARRARGTSTRRLVEAARVMRMGIAAPAHAVSAGERAACRRRLGLEGRVAVLSLGRLVPVKGVALLLEACAGLASVTLLVAGEGPERARLERRAGELGLAVRFLGEQLGREKAELLAAADLLALPSRLLADGRTDSAPVVLLEAMAAGLPLVASRVGGNAELIEDGVSGLLVESGEVAPLRAALARLAAEPALRARLAAAGREVAARHTWEALGPRVRSILGEL